MTYQGKGAWSWSLVVGRLQGLANQFVKSIGTDGFFDLM
jgi:hypothetical protein